MIRALRVPPGDRVIRESVTSLRSSENRRKVIATLLSDIQIIPARSHTPHSLRQGGNDPPEIVESRLQVLHDFHGQFIRLGKVDEGFQILLSMRLYDKMERLRTEGESYSPSSF